MSGPSETMLSEGTELEPRTFDPLTRTDIVRYQGASGDFHPAHHDDSCAQRHGYPGAFSMGMLHAGMLATYVTDMFGYYHFAGKQALLFSCLEAALMELVACGERALASAGPQPRTRLAAFTAAHVAFHIDRVELQAVYDTALYGMGHLAQSLSRKQQVRLVELQRRHLDNLRAVLRDGAARSQFRLYDLTVLAFAIIAMGDHVPSWFKPGGRLDRDALAEAHGELALRMAGARARKGS